MLRARAGGQAVTSFELEARDVRDPATRHLLVAGELDLTNAGELETAVAEAAVDGHAIALDLSEVTFVDSAALHALFRTSRSLGPHGFGLVVPTGSPLERAFDIVGLPKLVPVRPTLEELLGVLVSSS
jgi:anti-sigma B factor antagonist